MPASFNIKANLVDLKNKAIYPAEVVVSHGKISRISRIPESEIREHGFMMPGFVDAHIHIESAMLIPSEFARMAVVHGTVATISDPHEIANVMGMEGIEYMINNGNKVPFKFYFGAPSCVPATNFETAGAEITADDIRTLLKRDEIKYLAEMMNWPGVLFEDPDVMEKIKIAHELKKPVDGHAPGLKGDKATKYIQAGITTDHECTSEDEARHKLENGMKIQIREGSAAHNFDALVGLARHHADQMMFCSDDKHPHELQHGHINQLVKRAIEQDVDLFDALDMASSNVISHYNLEVGKLTVGDPADFIMVEDLKDFNVLRTYIDGKLVAENGKSLIETVPEKCINKFNITYLEESAFKLKPKSDKINVVVAFDGELITEKLTTDCLTIDNNVVSDVKNDILKYTVVNRYVESHPAIGFIKNLGLKKGAIACSVAHDSHNIVAVGVDDASICKAVNLLVDAKGGLAIYTDEEVAVLPLPVAGLMTNEDAYKVAEQYQKLLDKTKVLGSTMHDPFMTLSFMALLVIPSIKLSDKGLFDGEKFQFIDVFA
ncbi:adenine deaminase [Limibacter armeniacum]|uniref:adenine deaminase n=1 Tax=Limibacter armeniacum TaxID=466084 RepID=UPI002FE5AF30